MIPSHCFRWRISALVFVLPFLGLCRESAAAADDAAAKSAEIRAKMQTFVDQSDIAGAVTVVGNGAGVLSFEAVGFQNLEKKQPMPKDAVFRIASMTKPITATGIMMLADEGKLSIDDPVEKYLPEFSGQMLIAERGKDTITLKKPARPITIKELLTHTSGLPAMPSGLLDTYGNRYRTMAERVIALSQRPLEFEPGSKWAYCNSGIETLGRIIETVSGEPYDQFLQERIFKPLGMADTTFYPTDKQMERTAAVYDKKDGKLVAPSAPAIGPMKGVRAPGPAGGLYSTGADLARLYEAMLNGGKTKDLVLLSPKSFQEMTTVQTGDLKAGFVPGSGWGLGVGIVVKPTGITEMLSPGTYGHGGAYGTQAWIDPHKKLFYVLLIQRTGLANSDASPMRKEFQAAAMSAFGSGK
jgi:CubicO group peptidase (beta-lactamase class C family)